VEVEFDTDACLIRLLLYARTSIFRWRGWYATKRWTILVHVFWCCL